MDLVTVRSHVPTALLAAVGTVQGEVKTRHKTGHEIGVEIGRRIGHEIGVEIGHRIGCEIGVRILLKIREEKSQILSESSVNVSNPLAVSEISAEPEPPTLIGRVSCLHLSKMVDAFVSTIISAKTCGIVLVSSTE